VTGSDYKGLEWPGYLAIRNKAKIREQDRQRKNIYLSVMGDLGVLVETDSQSVVFLGSL